MAELLPARRKKNKVRNKELLELPLGPLLKDGIGTDNIYKGLYRYGFVIINEPVSATSLWENGYFGNGSITGSGLKYLGKDTQMNETVSKDGLDYEVLHLSHAEAMFLSYVLGVLILTNEGGIEMTIDDMWRSFCNRSSHFPVQYAVYHHLRCKRWVVKSGIKFGADWLLYQEGPPFCHSQFMVFIDCIWEDTLERDPRLSSRGTTYTDLAALERLSNQVGKSLLLCQVLRPRNLTEEELESVSCLKRFIINEILVEHWTPGMDVCNKSTADSSTK